MEEFEFVKLGAARTVGIEFGIVDCIVSVDIGSANILDGFSGVTTFSVDSILENSILPFGVLAVELVNSFGVRTGVSGVVGGTIGVEDELR